MGVDIFDAMETMKFLKFEPHAMPIGVRIGLLHKKEIIKVPKSKATECTPRCNTRLRHDDIIIHDSALCVCPKVYM